MEFWQHIYSQFNPVAFDLAGIKVHWYGIMYAMALIVAILMAHYIVKKDKIAIETDVLDNYIWWAEIGVILGARLGYILFYDAHTSYYLTHPWQIFNPFMDGTFVGISGMSYHGALAGFIIATIIFCKKYKVSFWLISDIAAIAVPLGYIFGRIGNFFNQELIGRATDVSWGIYVNGILRHPSQLYEAFLEGFVIFVVI
ncbi:MAG: prolipoprotein diacylglyceryl transferase, partial [Epsilonproteobacteria bacterium]|nr:prolipoprotein diacylglyceryl transferase [Campylobacterota bacterium]